MVLVVRLQLPSDNFAVGFEHPKDFVKHPLKEGLRAWEIHHTTLTLEMAGFDTAVLLITIVSQKIFKGRIVHPAISGNVAFRLELL